MRSFTPHLITKFDLVGLSMLQIFYQIIIIITYSLTILGLCPVSSRSLNLLMFSADLVVNKMAFHAGAILLLKKNFLTFVLLYIYSYISKEKLLLKMAPRSVSSLHLAVCLPSFYSQCLVL